jgi:hypothetical protein
MNPNPAAQTASQVAAQTRVPLAPVLFFLGLGLLLVSWLGFMGYYVFVKSKQPQPQPEVRALGRPPAAPEPSH